METATLETASLLLRAAPLLLDVFWKSLFVLAAAALAALMLRRRSAAARHALWLSAFVTLLFLPALCLWLPSQTLPVLPAAVSPPRLLPVQSWVSDAAPLPDRPAAPALFLGSAGPDRTTLRPPRTAEAVPARTVRPVPLAWSSQLWMPALLWMAGVGAVLGRIALGLASARRLIHGCVPVAAGPLAEAAGEARRALGLYRPVRLRQNRVGQAVVVPMTFGHFRPIVLLPQGASGWPAGRLRAVLLHEMAHIGRSDWAVLLLVRSVCALYWFHPLVWLAARRLRAEAEEACDDRVLLCGVPAPDYADHLLEIVRALPRRGGPFPAAVTMARNREIAGRLQTILAHPKSRGGVTPRGLVLAALTGLILVLPLAAMHPARRSAQIKTVAALTGVPWTARLSDGTLLKLVAVTRVDGRGHDTGASWAPDGSPLRGTAAAVGGSPLVALVNTLSDQTGNLSLRMAATSSKSYMVAGVSTSDNRRGHNDFGLRVSAGPFTTLVSAPLGRSASTRLPSGEMVMLSKGTTGLRNGFLVGSKPSVVTQVWLTVPVRFNTPDYDSRMEALGPDGKVADFPTFPQGADGSGPTRRLLYLFKASDLRSRRVTRLRFVTRPADHFTFRDVALYPNPSAGAAHPAAPPPVSQVFDPLDADPAARNRARQQRIKTALRLRASLRGWAVRNAALLQQMRRANPNDLAALLRVYAQVPPTRTSAAEATFTGLGAPPTLSHLRRSQEPLDVDLREDFARYRDFRLTRSVNTGLTFITLWASGRVTETTHTDRVVGRTRFFAVDHKDTADIAPAYPFLH